LIWRFGAGDNPKGAARGKALPRVRSYMKARAMRPHLDELRSAGSLTYRKGGRGNRVRKGGKVKK